MLPPCASSRWAEVTNGAMTNGDAANAANQTFSRASTTSSRQSNRAVIPFNSTRVRRSASTVGPSAAKNGAITHDSTPSMYSCP